MFCPVFQKLVSEYKKSPKIQKHFEQYAEVFKYLSENTGLTVKSYTDAFFLYMLLTTQKEFGLTLPEWTRKVYPQPLQSLTIKFYAFLTATSQMRRFTSGNYYSY